MEAKTLKSVFSWDVKVYWNVVCNVMLNKYREAGLDQTDKYPPPILVVMEEGACGGDNVLQDPRLVKLSCDGVECTLADVWEDLEARYEWGDKPLIWMRGGQFQTPAGVHFRVVYETES